LLRFLIKKFSIKNFLLRDLQHPGHTNETIDTTWAIDLVAYKLFVLLFRLNQENSILILKQCGTICPRKRRVDATHNFFASFCDAAKPNSLSLLRTRLHNVESILNSFVCKSFLGRTWWCLALSENHSTTAYHIRH
jgi:hypothetical protein